jgi:hypothetical protein
VDNEPLTNENFMIYAARRYAMDGYHTSEEFIEDLSRIKYVKKLITRYLTGDELKHRLIMNHVTILGNCFGPEATVKMLYLKLNSYMVYVKPFLVALNMLPERIHNVNGESIVYTDEIDMDPTIVEALRNEIRGS